MPKLQNLGIQLMMIIPVLILFGLFGLSSHAINETSSNLEMNVEFPSRLPKQAGHPLKVSIRNTSAEILPEVVVSFDRAYFQGMEGPGFTPQAETKDQDVYEVRLRNLHPGETQKIMIDMEALRPGQYKGKVTVSLKGREVTSMKMETQIH